MRSVRMCIAAGYVTHYVCKIFRSLDFGPMVDYKIEFDIENCLISKSLPSDQCLMVMNVCTNREVKVENNSWKILSSVNWPWICFKANLPSLWRPSCRERRSDRYVVNVLVSRAYFVRYTIYGFRRRFRWKAHDAFRGRSSSLVWDATRR